jgi:hypothetical protein
MEKQYAKIEKVEIKDGIMEFNLTFKLKLEPKVVMNTISNVSMVQEVSNSTNINSNINYISTDDNQGSNNKQSEIKEESNSSNTYQITPIKPKQLSNLDCLHRNVKKEGKDLTNEDQDEGCFKAQDRLRYRNRSGSRYDNKSKSKSKNKSRNRTRSRDNSFKGSRSSSKVEK